MPLERLWWLVNRFPRAYRTYRRVPGDAARLVVRIYKEGTSRHLKTRLMRRLGKTTVVHVKSRYGAEFDMSFDLDQGHDVAQFLLSVSKESEYEPEVADWMQSILREGSTFVDGGSNNGYFSIMASRIVGPTGRVFAFEPNPLAYARLLKNRDLNRAENCFPRMEALGDHKGVVRVVVDQLDDGLSRVTEETDGHTLDQTAEVPMSRLDEIALGGTPSLVKVDVEGYEIFAVRGTEGLSRNGTPPVLIVEWNPSYGTEELFVYLQERYRLYRCLIPGSDHRVKEVYGHIHLPHCNLLCIPRSLPISPVTLGLHDFSQSVERSRP